MLLQKGNIWRRNTKNIIHIFSQSREAISLKVQSYADTVFANSSTTPNQAVKFVSFSLTFKVLYNQIWTKGVVYNLQYSHRMSSSF